MTAMPGHGLPARGAGYLLASTADRERAVDVLKAGFVEGRLTKDEYDARTHHALNARTLGDLAVITADLPGGAAAGARLARPGPDQPSRGRLAGLRPGPAVHRFSQHDPGHRARSPGSPRDPPHR